MQNPENMDRLACKTHSFRNKDQPNTSTITKVKSLYNPFEKIEGRNTMCFKYRVLCETAPQATNHKSLALQIKCNKCIQQQT